MRGVRNGYLSELFVSFQGEGARVGERHLFVRFAGCNLRCRYCDTPNSLERTDHYAVRDAGLTETAANPITPVQVQRIVSHLLHRSGPVDAVSLTGGEPLVQADFIAQVLADRPWRLPVLLETGGVLYHRLKEVLEFVDVISMDVKLPSNTGEKGLWREHEEFLALARKKAVYVKVPVDRSTAEADVRRAVDLIAGQDDELPVYLQPILDSGGRPLIDLERLSAFFSIARGSLRRVRVLGQMHRLLSIP